MSSHSNKQNDADMAEVAKNSGIVNVSGTSAEDGENASRDGQSREQLYDMELCGRFQVCSVLGGGMGMVYKCRDSQHPEGGFVVLKKIDDCQASRAEDIELLRKTMFAVDALHHPGIVRMFDIYKDDETGAYYQCMAFVEGLDMEVWLANQQGMAPQRELLEISRKTADALDAIHDIGVVHCDVKPSNIMIQATEDRLDVVLVDFSWARELPRRGVLSGNRTVRAAGGTPRYMAPEQWVGGECTPALDQYSLAVSMYEAFSGAAPFDDLDPEILREDVMQRQPPWVDGLDGFVNYAFQRALSKQPSDRYDRCSAFSRALSGAAPQFGKYIAFLSVAVVVVTGLLIARRSPRQVQPSNDWQKKLDAVVAKGNTVEMGKRAVAEFNRTIQLCRTEIHAGELEKAECDLRAAEAYLELVQLQKADVDKRLDSLTEQLKFLRQNVDISLLFSAELNDAEKKIRTLEARREFKDFPELLEQLPEVEGTAKALEDAYESRLKDQKSTVVALRKTLTAECEILGASSLPAEIGKKMLPYLQTLRKLLESGEGLQSYASRAEWLETATAGHAEFTGEVSSASGNLRKDIQTMQTLAEEEKVKALNLDAWQTLSKKLTAISQAPASDVQAFVDAAVLKQEMAKVLEADRARKRQLRNMYTKARNDGAAVLKALEEAHVVLPEVLKKAMETDGDALCVQGEWQKAEELSRDILIMAREVQKEYREFSSVWVYVVDGQKNGLERYGQLLADDWNRWMEQCKAAGELGNAGRYREARQMAAELKATYDGFEGKREILIAKKGGDLRKKWVELKEILEKFLPEKWLDATVLQSLDKEFRGYMDAEAWDKARDFLERQRQLAAHLDTYGQLWKRHAASCDEALAQCVLTRKAFAEQIQAFAQLVSAGNWTGADEFVAVQAAQLATRMRYHATLKPVNEKRIALAEKLYNKLLPDDWKALDERWAALPALLNITEENIEQSLAAIAQVKVAYGEFEKKGSDCLSKRWAEFVTSQKAFEHALEMACQQKRLNQEEEQRYRQTCQSCIDGWRKGEWEEREQQLVQLRQSLRTQGVGNKTVALAEGVSMTLLPLTAGGYKKTFVIHHIWPFDDEKVDMDVEIPETLWMGQTEVSAAQYWGLLKEHREMYETLRRSENWQRFVKPVEDESLAGMSYGQLPVADVTWEQAALWCEMLTAVEEKNGRLPNGYVYRLPTEAEWEYAAILGGEKAENLSENPLGDVLCDSDEPVLVSAGKPNDWQFYHMPGNVCEWCLDVYRKDVFNAPELMKMVPDFTTSKRVVKGNCYETDEEDCDIQTRTDGRSAYFARANQGNGRSSIVVTRTGRGDETIGFRIVLGRKIESQK